MKFLIAGTMFFMAIAAHAQQTDSLYTNRNATTARLFSSVGGAAAGAVVGGFIGYNAFSRDCGCDDPGLDNLIYGGLAGIAVGAALGAALPDMQSACDFKTRFTRSLVGSAIASSAAFLLSGVRTSATIVVVPVASVGGSLGALGRCWKSKR
jgi:hypothetical protein